MYINNHTSSKPRTTLKDRQHAELSDSIYTAIKQNKTRSIFSVFKHYSKCTCGMKLPKKQETPKNRATILM